MDLTRASPTTRSCTSITTRRTSHRTQAADGPARTREDEVDRFLRGGMLVDLFRAVRQGLRARSRAIRSSRSRRCTTSLAECLSEPAPASSIEGWLQPASGPPRPEILAAIAAYNRDDVRSTLGLRDWSSSRARARETVGQEVPRPAEVSPEAPEQLREADARDARVPSGDGRRAGGPHHTQQGGSSAWFLAQFLAWHRREAKIAFWEFFHRLGMDAAELTADKAALGPLESSDRSANRAIRRRARTCANVALRSHPRTTSRERGRSPTTPKLIGAGRMPSGAPEVQAGLVDDEAVSRGARRPPGVDAKHPEALVPHQYLR